MNETPSDKAPWHWGHISFEFLKERDTKRVRLASVLLMAFAALVLVAFLYVFVTLLAAMGAGSVEDKAKAGAVLLTTLAALFAAPFLIWRMILTHQSTQAALAQVKAAEEKLDIDRETQNTTLYLKAVEMLGAIHNDKSHNIEARVGALNILERIARTTSSYHNQIIDIVCAYIRNNFPRYYPDPQSAGRDLDRWDADEMYWPKPRADLSTAISMLAYRKENWLKPECITKTIGLRNSDIAGVDLTRGDLSNADLSHCDMHGVIFSYANLQGTNLEASDCEQTRFYGADMRDIVIEGNELKFAKGNILTWLSDNIIRPENWMGYDD